MASVEWDVADFRAAGVVGREGSLMELHAGAGRSAEDVMHAFVVAVDAANEELAAAEAMGRELYGFASAVVPGPRGPVATFGECEPVAALRLYLATVAGALERQGVGGRLVPVQAAEIDRWFGNNSFAALTLVLSLAIDRDAVMSTANDHGTPQQRWWVDDRTTDSVVGPLVDWVLDAGPRIDLAIGFTAPAVVRSEVREQVRRGLATTARVHLQVDAGPSRMRRLVTSPYGDVLVHDFDPATDTLARLATMVELLADAGPHLRAGWIQQGATSMDDRHMLLSLVEPTHPLGQATATMAWRLLPLEDGYVYDARVAQVLTHEQAERMPDLDASRWTAGHLGRDRMLVQHTHPELWLDLDPSFDPLPAPTRHTDPIVRSPVPDDVLATARGDFANAILVPELLDRPR